MASTLAAIRKRIETLQREAEALKAREKKSVVERIKEAIAHYAITADELGLAGQRGNPGRKPGPKPATNSASKPGGRPAARARSGFGDAAGNRWGGRGPRPAWFKAALAAGKTPDELRL